MLQLRSERQVGGSSSRHERSLNGDRLDPQDQVATRTGLASGSDFSGVTIHTGPTVPPSPQRSEHALPLLQRTCACGGESSGPTGECEACRNRRLGLQTKLTIGARDDAYEQEADRVAEQVTRTASTATALLSGPPTISRKCAACDAQAEHVHPTSRTGHEVGSEGPALVHDVLRSPGRALDPAARAYFEPRFGRDFGRVRIHDDARAAASARSIRALAYTSGQHIVFGTGAPSPRSDVGRKLFAHELTHTVQQSSGAAFVSAGAGVLQRQAERWKPASFPGSSAPFFPGSLSHDTELYFGRDTDVCRSCHQASEQDRFQLRKVQHAQVTDSKIREWAATDAWGEAIISGRSLDRRQLFRLLLRGEDKKLDAVWESYRSSTVAKIRPDLLEDLSRPVFLGSDAARAHWADYVDANWSTVVADLDRRALDWLVREIRETLHTSAIPAGATLVTDPARVAAIEDSPGRERIELGRWGATATVGFEWVKKRIKSAEPYRLDFEVIGREGIYFEMSVSDFLKGDPFVGKVAADVAAGTKGITVLGKFIKGMLTAVASPVTIALDTTAKVIDMASQGVSALGKWRGWYDVGYTCLSSTCQQYEACINSEQSPGECQSEALRAALEEATVLIPLYRQGRECLAGDAEACGGIAIMALGLVKEGGTPLAKPEFEEAAIRSAIDRPRAGDPTFARAFEPLEKTRQQHGTKAAAEPQGRPHTPEEPPARPKHEPAATGAARETTIEGFAKAAEIAPAQLRADLAALRKNAADPGLIRLPADVRFDAEISTTANGESHTFDREKATPGRKAEPRTWCRFSPAPRCGVPVDPEVDRLIDAAQKTRGRSKPAKQPPTPPPAEKTLTAREYEKRKAAAEEAFEFGDQPGQISAEVGRHRDAPAIREAEGLSGRQVQSAHDAPTAFMKSLDDYSRDNAITMLIDKDRHRSFDQTWKDWAQDQRRLGRTTVTVQELHGVMADAIERAKITDGQKSALFGLLNEELTQKHGLTLATKLELPYSNVPALKPGPELRALKTRVAAEQKARASSAAATAAREGAHIPKAIEAYTRVAEKLERSGDKARAQVWRLEIEKLKRRRRK